MCLIALDTRRDRSDERLPREVFDRAAEINPDGMGIMWSWNGSLRIWRTMDDIEGIYSRYCNARAREINVAVHFRATTRGTTGELNLHPFEIAEGQLAFMHNGTIKSIPRTKIPVGVSDSAFINESLFRNINPEALDPATCDDGLIECVHQLLNGDRMLFMNGDGHWQILNSYSQGACWKYGSKDKGGVWLSKGKDLDYILEGKEKKSSIVKVFEGKGKKKDGKNGSSDSYSEEEKEKWWKEHRSDNSDPQERGINPSEYGRYLMGDTWEEDDTVEYGDDTPPVPKEAKQTPISLAQSGNLIFDYGYLDWIQFPKEDFNFSLRMIGSLNNSQLVALGAEGEGRSMPAVLNPAPEYKTRGKVYSVPRGKIEEALAELDTYHGCQYGDPGASVFYREKRFIDLAEGGYVEAWVYDHRVQLNDFRMVAPVPHGDWQYWRGEHDEYAEVGHVLWVPAAITGTGAHDCPKCGSNDTYTYSLVPKKERDEDTLNQYELECFECENNAEVIVDASLAEA